MNRVNQVAGEPKGDPFSPSPFTFPSSHTPPFIFRFTWGAGREEGGRGAQEGAGEARRSEKCPPSLANSGACSAPSSRGGGHCKAPPLALHRGSAERASGRPALATPGAAAAGEPRAQRSSNLPCRRGRPHSGLPPRPAAPLKPPGLATAAPGAKTGRGWDPGGAAASGEEEAAAAGRPVR